MGNGIEMSEVRLFATFCIVSNNYGTKVVILFQICKGEKIA
jgi:hypothetical protein